jgi:hypothetical protein
MGYEGRDCGKPQAALPPVAMKARSRSDPEGAPRRPKQPRQLARPHPFRPRLGGAIRRVIFLPRASARPASALYFLAARAWASISLSQRPQVFKRLSAIEIGVGRVMTEKHGFLETLKHVAFEDEPAPPEKHTPAQAPPVPYALPIDAGVVPDGDAVYQTLLAKTDFEGTPDSRDDPQVSRSAQGHPGHGHAFEREVQDGRDSGHGAGRIDGRRDSGNLRHAEGEAAAGKATPSPERRSSTRPARLHWPAGPDSEDHRTDHGASAAAGSVVKRIGGCAGQKPRMRRASSRRPCSAAAANSNSRRRSTPRC